MNNQLEVRAKGVNYKIKWYTIYIQNARAESRLKLVA